MWFLNKSLARRDSLKRNLIKCSDRQCEDLCFTEMFDFRLAWHDEMIWAQWNFKSFSSQVSQNQNTFTVASYENDTNGAVDELCTAWRLKIIKISINCWETNHSAGSFTFHVVQIDNVQRHSMPQQTCNESTKLNIEYSSSISCRPEKRKQNWWTFPSQSLLALSTSFLHRKQS